MERLFASSLLKLVRMGVFADPPETVYSCAGGSAKTPYNGALSILDVRSGRVMWSLNANPGDDFTAPVFYHQVLFASAYAAMIGRFCPTNGQDAVVAINPSNGAAYWSTANATDLMGIFDLD